MAEEPVNSSEDRDGRASSRRSVLHSGRRLALAAPAALAALHAGVASADNGRDRVERDLERLREWEEQFRERMEHFDEQMRKRMELLEERLRARLGQGIDDRDRAVIMSEFFGAFQSRLFRVADAGADLPESIANNRGDDRLAVGAVSVVDNWRDDTWDGRVYIRLRDVRDPNNNLLRDVEYEVYFVTLRGAETSLGRMRTDGDGDIRGWTPNKLPQDGSSTRPRAGFFVLRRPSDSNKPQFASAIAG